MIISIVYLLVRCLLGCLAVLTRRQMSKDAELLVLRHENTVPRRAALPLRAALQKRRSPSESYFRAPQDEPMVATGLRTELLECRLVAASPLTIASYLQRGVLTSRAIYAQFENSGERSVPAERLS